MEIEVVAYDSQWEVSYHDEAAVLKEMLGSLLWRSFHVGSTAVPGLAAKPVIDMVLVVKELKALDEYHTWFTELGYAVLGENGIAGRRFYVKGEKPRTHHLHAFQMDNLTEIGRHVFFRDYLRAHPAVCQTYSELKRALAQQFPDDRHGYVAGKHESVKEIEAQAIEWYWQKKPSS